MITGDECELRLAEIMKQKGMNKTQLSKLSGVSRPYISEIANDLRDNPSIFIVSRLCVGLDCTIDELIRVNPNMDMAEYRYYPSCS